MGFGNVFYYDGYIIVPCADSLVVRGGHEPSVLVDKGDGVDGSQVLVILLCDLTRVDIILERRVSAMIRMVTWHTCMIFLSDMPARKMCCLSSSGWKRTTYGVFPLLKRLRH